jgi:hypothetical protein
MDAPAPIPEPFRQTAPDRVVIREGGGCLSAFGTPFLAAGVFVTLIGLQVIPVSNRDEVPSWAWPLIFLMGLAFVAVGVHLVFGRRWTTLDRGKGVIVLQSGVLVPQKREQRDLSDFAVVRIRFEAGDSDTTDRYPVTLQGRADRADTTLSSPTDYAVAREQAQFASGFLRLPLVDATTDHEAVVSAGGETTASSQSRAARPPFMKSEVEQTRGQVRIVIPGPRFQPHILLGLFIPVALAGYFVPGLLEFFERTGTPGYVQVFFAGFILLFFGVLPAIGTFNGIIRSIRGRTTVEATAAGIRIEEQGAWRRRATVIPAAEIFGLDYGLAETSLRAYARAHAERFRRPQPVGKLPGPAPAGGAPAWMRRLVTSRGVQVKCRQGIVPFGAGLPDDEVRYLHALVESALGEVKR